MKGYRGNGGRNTIVYDDVFGGPPKFGATTLPPRLEDYTEIFQGFHASRGSSIPVLDLPAAGEVWFDVRSSKVDYSEVFGGSSGLDFVVSYEELFSCSKGVEDDSSDDVWTPAQSESLSDESDPYASLDMNQQVPTADPNQLFGVESKNELNLVAEKDVLNSTANNSQFLDLAGSTVLDNQVLPSKTENEKFFSLANNDHCATKDFGGVAEGKRHKKSLSQPLDSVSDTQNYGSDQSNLVGDQKAYPVGNRPPRSVSDLGLKTQPSHLPPPSRPPPSLTPKKGDTSSSKSKLKTSKSYAFERMAGDQSPPYFDIEIDASSSAAADAAAMKDAVQQAQATLRSAKEKMNRKKGGLQSRSKLRIENNVVDKKGIVHEGSERSNSLGDERMKGSLERDNTITRHEVIEENQKMKMTKDVKLSVEGEKNITEAGNSFERKTVKQRKVYLGGDETKETVASREATEPFNTDAGKQVQDAGILELNSRSRGFKKNNKVILESFEHKEDDKIVQESEFCGLEENGEGRETFDDRKKKHLREPAVAHKTCKLRETEKRFLASQQHEIFKAPIDSDKNELYENLIEIRLKNNDLETGVKIVGSDEKVLTENKLEDDNEMKGDDMGLASYDWEGYDIGHQEAIEKEHETEEHDGKEFQQPGHPEISKMQSEEDHEREDGERIVQELFQWEENANGSVKASEQEKMDDIWETVSEQDENIMERTLDHNQKILQEKPIQEEEKIKVEEALLEEEMKKKEETYARDDKVQTLNHARANEKIDCNSDNDNKLDREREESDEVVSENDSVENEQDAGIKWDDDDKRLNSNEESESVTWENSEASDVVYQVDDNEILQAAGDVQHGIPSENNDTSPETPCSVKRENVEETDEQTHGVDEESSSFELNQNDLQGVEVKVRMENAENTYGANVIGQTPTEVDKRTSEFTSGSRNESDITGNHVDKRPTGQGGQAGFHPDRRTNTTTSPHVAKEWVEAGTRPLTDQVDSSRNTYAASKVTGRSMEKKDENSATAVSENRVKEERLRRARELENERLRKIEEERERQIEREKDRMAVDQAILEAREKAFAETRDRAERAAVERATAEFRQRALADARERLEKACAEARERSPAEKAMEWRLKVGKATAETPERAERPVGDKFSAYQNNTMRQNSISSDLPDSQFQKCGSYSGLRYPQTAAQSGGEGESPQRCKARLERHQRTADRAAKALAEKNMRDLVAQKEQAERNRLAEVLDAEVKRWSSGKQGNLRALLSTLQYILGSDSGWQPVPLTEVITTSAVRKAYRKATLCVHPDKLQQRGASIQQKYICEKVFDLLKEAWNKFNSEER